VRGRGCGVVGCGMVRVEDKVREELGLAELEQNLRRNRRRAASSKSLAVSAETREQRCAVSHAQMRSKRS